MEGRLKIWKNERSGWFHSDSGLVVFGGWCRSMQQQQMAHHMLGLFRRSCLLIPCHNIMFTASSDVAWLSTGSSHDSMNAFPQPKGACPPQETSLIIYDLPPFILPAGTGEAWCCKFGCLMCNISCKDTVCTSMVALREQVKHFRGWTLTFWRYTWRKWNVDRPDLEPFRVTA